MYQRGALSEGRSSSIKTLHCCSAVRIWSVAPSCAFTSASRSGWLDGSLCELSRAELRAYSATSGCAPRGNAGQPPDGHHARCFQVDFVEQGAPRECGLSRAPIVFVASVGDLPANIAQVVRICLLVVRSTFLQRLRCRVASLHGIALNRGRQHDRNASESAKQCSFSKDDYLASTYSSQAP